MAIMTSRQAAELDFAFERNGWTADDVKRMSGGDLLTKLLPVVRERAEVVIKLILAHLRTFRVIAQPAITTSEEYFKEAGVNWMGDNFKAQFLGLEISATDEAELAVHNLEEASFDAPILAELGAKAEISVSQFRAFLAANRESSEWFIFYLRGRDGNIWAVRACWLSGHRCWCVRAYSVGGPHRWGAGLQVCSRDS